MSHQNGDSCSNPTKVTLHSSVFVSLLLTLNIILLNFFEILLVLCRGNSNKRKTWIMNPHLQNKFLDTVGKCYPMKNTQRFFNSKIKQESQKLHSQNKLCLIISNQCSIYGKARLLAFTSKGFEKHFWKSDF